MSSRKKVAENFKAVCSVSEMARQLGLSRSRFYQLQRAGVVPLPVYCIVKRHPFYPEALQQVCHAIYRSGIGYNGQLVLFYHRHKQRTRKSASGDRPSIKWLTGVLQSQLGMKVTAPQIQHSIKTLFPQGLAARTDKKIVLETLLQYLHQQRSGNSPVDD